MNEQQITFALMSYVVFLFSTTCHEAAHAWAANRLGDDTAYMLGHVTLDPTPHIKREPIGMVAVPLVSVLMGLGMFGWASVPFNPQWALRWPKRCALMAMAGPAANFALMVLAVLLLKLGISAGVFEQSFHTSSPYHIVTEAHQGPWSFAAQMLCLFFAMNMLLGIFNLIPLPPLDGASILYLVLPNSASRSLMLMRGGLGFLGVLIAWKVFDFIYPPVRLALTEFFFSRAAF